MPLVAAGGNDGLGLGQTAAPAARDFDLDPNAGGARYVLAESGLLYEMIE